MFHITATVRDILPDFSVGWILQPRQIWAASKMYTTLDVDKQQIRLASILPGRWSEDVCCELDVISLDDKPSYEALSYTWGDPSDKTPIFLQGVMFPATKSLHLALQRLRYVGEKRHIWVDALCINQTDSKLSLCPRRIPASVASTHVQQNIASFFQDTGPLKLLYRQGDSKAYIEPEKMRQIQLMKEIYAGATEVQVYLGESRVLETITAEEQSTWAEPPRSFWFGDDRDRPSMNNYGTWQTMAEDQLLRCSPTIRLRGAISSAYTILILLAQGRCLRDFILEDNNPKVWAETLSVLHHLASSPWWKRVWVVEEVILSRSATIIYGEVVAPLDSVERGGSMIPIHIENCCRDFYQSLSSDQQLHIRAIGQHTAALEGLRHEWNMFADKEADRLQRFLGLTRAREAYDDRDKVYSLLGLTKDCSERLSIVPDYSATASEVYIHTAFQIIRHTNSLEILATVEKKRCNSKVPTWCPDWSSSSNGEENDLWVHSRSWKFDAGPSNGNVANLCHERVLAVKGVHVDVVAATTFPLSQGEELAPRLEEFANLVGYDSKAEAPHFRGGTVTVRDMFWRTMLNDALESEANKHKLLTEEDEASFILWWNHLKVEHATLRRAMAPPEQQARLRIIARSFWLPNDNRAFFTTQQGYMGFGPPDMKQGDLVAVLLGSKMPFILRRAPPPPATVGVSEGVDDKAYYSIVGYCYLHGVMKGEAVGNSANISGIDLI